MRKNPVLVGLIIIGVLLVLFGLGVVGTIYGLFGDHPVSIGSNSVLVMEVKGVISDSKQFLKDLRRYSEDHDLKAIVIRVDSPGGVVGPSQEMYKAIMDLRKTGHVVVASLGSVAASGGYYVASAADKIVTNPGTITGSIGVIMEFADISRLYDWAKINRYVIKTGPFKDTGAEFRPMTPAEKVVMQQVIDNVFMQFKKAVAIGRKMPLEKVTKFADGRIMSGEQAVDAGLADQEGSLDDAIELAAKLAGLKGKPEPVYSHKSHPKFFDLLMNPPDDESRLENLARKVLHMEYIGQPLFIMPGVVRW